MTAKPALRPLLPADIPMLAAIFRASIDLLTQEDYDAGQREAWIATGDDEAAFGQRVTGALTLVATLGGVPAGFASLKDNRVIDLLYVHPDVARQGVATLLVDALERLAGARGAKDLETEASDTAQIFFLQRGFTAERRSTVSLGDEWLSRTQMKKLLAAPEGPLQ